MTKEILTETRAKYEPPILEKFVFMEITGISLPVGTNILEEESK